LHIFPDNNEKIKIQELRNFIAHSYIKSSYRFQVFLIENISRATLESFNASLKFLEEP
jgi:DNA polymerase III gamma/tau subunit